MKMSIGEKKTMTMNKWIEVADDLLKYRKKNILKDAGKILHEIACDKALTEFEKYRVKQDRLYKSDFDLLLEEMESQGGENNGK